MSNKRKREFVDYSYDAILGRLFDMGFRLCDTKEQYEAKMKTAKEEAKRPGYTKVEVQRTCEDANPPSKHRLQHLLNNHSKLETKAEKEQRRQAQMAARPKGSTREIDAEHRAINEFLHKDFVLLREGRFTDFAWPPGHEGEAVPFGQVTVLNLNNGVNNGNTGKTFGKIRSYLALGCCFICIVLKDDRLYGMYFLKPCDHNVFKDDVLKQFFCPSPFKKRVDKKDSTSEIMRKFLVKADAIEQELEEYRDASETPRHTIKFLNEDESMMGKSNWVEQQYFTRLSEVGMPFVYAPEYRRGDVFIDGDVLTEFKGARQNGNGFHCHFIRKDKAVMDCNEVHCFAVVLPDRLGVIFFPTRTKNGKNAFGAGLALNREMFGCKLDADGKVTADNQHLDPGSAHVLPLRIDNNTDAVVAAIDIIKGFKERKLIQNASI